MRKLFSKVGSGKLVQLSSNLQTAKVRRTHESLGMDLNLIRFMVVLG